MNDYLRAVSEFTKAAYLVRDNYVFRGIKELKHQLEPCIARPAGSGDKRLDHEEGVIRNFRKYSVTTPPDFRQGCTHWDWLALAQHHGAPTRLLDWTWSPIVALYFAMWRQARADLECHDSAIWCIDPIGVLEGNPDSDFKALLGGYLRKGFGPYTLHAEKLREMAEAYERRVEAGQEGSRPLARMKEPPLDTYDWFTHDLLHGLTIEGERRSDQLILFMELRSSNPRLVAQSGIFSVMSGTPKDVADVLKERAGGRSARPGLPDALTSQWPVLTLRLGEDEITNKFDVLAQLCRDLNQRPLAIQIVLPRNMKVHLRDWLYTLRINDRNMFPDLDGLGAHTRAMYDDLSTRVDGYGNP